MKLPTKLTTLANRAQTYFQSGRYRKDWRFVAVVVVSIGLVGAAGTYLGKAGQFVDEDTVLLSNGKAIHLGESVESMKAVLGKELFKINPNQYSYPGIVDKPIEVVIGVDQGKIVVIHIVSGDKNVPASNRIPAGATLERIAAADKRRSRALSGELARLRANGLAIAYDHSTQYAFEDPCSQGKKADLISLVAAGHENRLVEDLGGPGCKGE